jgi:TRAP-type mannitol/chloroaromatic compound transport system substrate-binding protein
MRIAGLGGLVVAKAGGSAVVTPAGDIFGAFERGVIDAAEWVGPHDDMKLGLQNTARYYYYPGWHEPGTVSDFGFNRKAYDALPADLKQILDLAAASIQIHGSTEYHAKNALALERLKTEYKGKVELVQFPASVLRDLKKLRRGRPRAVRAQRDGQEGERVVRQVPGGARPMGRPRRGLVPPAPQEVTRGSRTENVLPTPGWDVTPIVPACAVTI